MSEQSSICNISGFAKTCSPIPASQMKMIPASIVLGASVAGAMRLSCPASFDTRIYRGKTDRLPFSARKGTVRVQFWEFYRGIPADVPVADAGGNQQNPCELKENGGVIATTPVYRENRGLHSH